MLDPKFSIFSTELGPSLDPTSLEDLEDLVVFSRDPIATGTYNPYAGSQMRGSVIPTLGGVVVQDFGVQIQDQRITISDEAAMSKAKIDALIALYEVSDGEYYFTDGYDCWKFKFARPNGFAYRRNLIAASFGIHIYDYEMSLVVTDKENV
jgi:hypothetical protein